MIFLYIIALLISFYLLTKVCEEYFVNSLDKISHKLKLSSEAAGATLMAVGSSAPELFVSLIALIKPGDHGAIGAGTIVGSAIFNILVIIGGSIVVKKAFIKWQPVVRDLIFYSISILLLLLVFKDGFVDFYEALIFIITYSIYIIAVLNWKKLLKYKDKEDPYEHVAEEVKGAKKWHKFTFILDFIVEKTFPAAEKYYQVFFISIIWIIALSWTLVESAVSTAHILGIPEVIIGLTVLAAGTSIPDLISSLIVAKQGRSDMAVSNAVGSNIFDILFGLGMPWLFTIIFFGNNIAVDNTNLYSSIILLFATVITIGFLFLIKRWKLGKLSGWFLIVLYIIYILGLIITNYLGVTL